MRIAPAFTALLALSLAGCPAKTPEEVAPEEAAPEEAAPEAAAPEKTVPEAAAPEKAAPDKTRPPGPALLEAGPLKRGDAALPVRLDTDGTLRVGDSSLKVEFADPKRNPETWKAQAKLSVVTLEPGQPIVVLATPTADSEDPPNRYQVFLVGDGAITKAFDQRIGTYGVHPLNVKGDGAIFYVEDGWTACERAKFPKEATRQKVSFTLDATGKAFVESGRADTAEKMKCNELAACPFVYRVEGSAETRLGEILRYLRGADAYAEQTLEIPGEPGERLHLRLKEEKLEITYLDAVHLEVGSVRVMPERCEAKPAPAHCVPDHQPYVMRPGDTLDLVFRIPAGAESEPARLVARGYYVPIPAVSQRDRGAGR